MVEESHLDRLKEISQQLDDSYLQLNTFFELSVDLLAIADKQGYYKRLSKSWEDCTGYTREELMAVPFVQFIYDPDLQSRTWDELRKVRNGHATVDFTNRYRRKDNGWIKLQWRSMEVNGLIYAVARVIETSDGTSSV